MSYLIIGFSYLTLIMWLLTGKLYDVCDCPPIYILLYNHIDMLTKPDFVIFFYLTKNILSIIHS